MNPPAASGDAASEEIQSEHAESPDAGATLPADAEEWRAHIAAVSPRDLLRVLIKDKTIQGRVFAGFRPGTDTLRRSVVVQRIVELMQKDGKLAKQVAELTATKKAVDTLPLPSLIESDPPPHPTVPPAKLQPESTTDNLRLRDKLREQRAGLRDRETRIAELEAQLRDAEKDRDSARQMLIEAEAAQRAAEAGAERERRHRERASRREISRAGSAETLPQPASSIKAESVSMPPAPPDSANLLIDGLERLLSRGKFVLVAEVCRESVAAAEAGALATSISRGKVHALYAAALYSLGNATAGANQDQLAAVLLLDGGDLVASATCLGRTLITAPHIRAASLTPTFRRLVALAVKLGQTERVRDALIPAQIASPEISRRLQEALDGSAAGSGKLYDLLKLGAGSVRIGADEEIALPTISERTATVTARKLVRAFEAGDDALVANARSGIRQMQHRGDSSSEIANALLEAVAALDPLAVIPLTKAASHPVVVDASNVARHNPDPLSMSSVTRLKNLLQMRDYLARRGFFPILLIADASLRFAIDDKVTYKELINRGVIRETPSGTEADEALISEARSLASPLITNDRLSDWGSRAVGVDRLGFAILRDGITLTSF